MQIFIYCKATLHVSGVTAPIIRSIKNCTRNLRYRSYYLYRYSPPTWSDRDCILLHLLDFYSHWITMHGTTSLKYITDVYKRCYVTALTWHFSTWFEMLLTGTLANEMYRLVLWRVRNFDRDLARSFWGRAASLSIGTSSSRCENWVYSIVQYCTVLYSIVQYCIVLYRIV